MFLYHISNLLLAFQFYAPQGVSGLFNIIYNNFYFSGGKTGKGKSKNFVYLKIASVAVLSFVVIAGIILISSKDSFIGKRPQPSKDEQRKPKDTPKTKAKDAPKPKADDLKKLLNKHDKSISDVFRKATKMLDGKRVDDAVREFSFLSEKYPKSPYARYGKAKAIDEEAERKRNNELLLEAIKLFNTVPDIEDCPSALKKLSLLRSAERLSFLGKSLRAVRVLEKLVAFLPSDPDVNRALGVQYLIAGETAKALAPFKKVKLIASRVLKTIKYCEDGGCLLRNQLYSQL